MTADEYDQLIEDPTGYLYNVWFPRVSKPLSPIGQSVTFEHNLTIVKGVMAMNQFVGDLAMQQQRLRTETGTAPAIAGMLRAPFDMLADKLRGYLGLVEDLMVRPKKVLAACEALMPHLTRFALATADSQRQVPLGFWMHRGCVPFVSFDQFREYFWATLKPIVLELWAHGHQTLFYAEGNWDHHLHAFAELPEQSIVCHIDQSDALKVHRILGDRFCLSGGIPNLLLANGTPDEVRQHCRKIIQDIGANGGYVLDASAIIQNDAKPENLKAMTEAVQQFGVYSQGHASPTQSTVGPAPQPQDTKPGKFVSTSKSGTSSGSCIPWSEVRPGIPTITGDETICRDVWNQIDSMGYMFIWTLFLVF